MSTDPKKLKDEISAKYNLPCVDPLKDDLAEIISTLKNIK